MTLLCTKISPSYSSQTGNARFRPYATCFSQYLPLCFGLIYTHVTFIPDNLSHYLFAHLYSKSLGPPHLPTQTFLADHLIRRWKLFNAHFVYTLPSREIFKSLFVSVLFYIFSRNSSCILLTANPGCMILHHSLNPSSPNASIECSCLVHILSSMRQ